MRKLVAALAGLLLVVNVGFGQETMEDLTKNSVDLVDFFAAVVEGNKDFLHPYVKDTTYVLKDTTIMIHYDSLYLEALGEASNTFANRVRYRLNQPFSDEPLQVNQEILFINISADGTLTGPDLINSEITIDNVLFQEEFSLMNYDDKGSSLYYFNFKNCSFSELYFNSSHKRNELRFENSEFRDPFRIQSTNLNIHNTLFNTHGFLSAENSLVLHSNTFQRPQADTLSFFQPAQNPSHAYMPEEPAIITRANTKKKGSDYTFHHLWMDRKNLDSSAIQYFKNKADTPVISYLQINCWNSSAVLIKNNSFKGAIPGWVNFKGGFRTLEIQENDFGNALIDFNHVRIEDLIEISDNQNIKHISIERALFSELKNRIHWSDISGFKLFVNQFANDAIPSEVSPFLSANDPSVFQDEKTYLKLLESYKTLYDQYKTNGFTPFANGCYAEMKVLETRWWKQQYKEQPSFENYFRWKLNEFLNFFTDYGTNPAKAVVKSIWVILIFSVFYLFFPSDWDVSNRSELLKRGKELFSKNRSTGILSNLGFLLYTGFIHALNAITLSMNAFTTLGFGDIPTRGAARYVTIVQGLIGWFLLTIFSVSLINQVLG